MLLLDDWAWILVTGFEYVCSHRDEMLLRKRKYCFEPALSYAVTYRKYRTSRFLLVFYRLLQPTLEKKPYSNLTILSEGMAAFSTTHKLS